MIKTTFWGAARKMNLTDEAVAILSPAEMRQLRRLSGWSLSTLARYSAISIAQLCQYERSQNGLSVQQVRSCKEILLGGVVERAELIHALIAKERDKAQIAASKHLQAEMRP
jgi:transcriptional regulator with XRE-family HTH domain